jgi:hypothetical protein
MPVSMKRIAREGGGSVLIHVCEVCGADAPFGCDVHIRLALNRLAEGDKFSAKRLLGKWYCREHKDRGSHEVR